jgi:TonB-linked SusC/RagA family outer membrane protein
MIERHYKRWGLVVTLLLMFSYGLYAQERLITGTVKDANGGGIPGVNVLVKGTANGTTSDTDGKYSISVNGGSLVFSFIGFITQEVEVGSQTTIDVTLAEDITQLSEVVVTALGIERNTKALQSSVTQISGENFTQARENSLGNALAGRVAGVNVNKISSGPAGSSRVVIRGAKTLGSTLNQPLYVVDGIPMDNTNFGQSGVWGGADQGDGVNSISPDDIQSTTILKGASAAALYGSRAANGVILITTKKGTSRKGLGIEFNSNYVFETINNVTDFQKSNGNGGLVGTTLQNQVAKTPSNLTEHWGNWWGLNGWGPRYNGSSVVQFDGVSRPYSYQGDNFSRFFNTGTSATNTVAFTGGSETQNFRFSVSDLRSKGIIPNSGFDRLNISLATNSKFGKKLTLTAKVMYSNEKAKNRPNVSDSPGNASLAVYYTPGDVNIDNLRGDPNKPGAVPTQQDQQDKGITIFDGKAPGEEFQVSNNLWTQNPWWVAYQFRNDDVRNRVITSGQLRYDITDFLYAQVKGGMDQYTKKGTQLTPEGTGYQRGGNMTEYENRSQEINLEYILGFNKTFGMFNVNAFFGGNQMRNKAEYLAANGNGFNVPFFAAINNAKQRNFSYGISEFGINSLFGSAEVSYNNYLYVTATARQDWFSVLNPNANSILYPSIGTSFVFSDAFSGLPSWLSFGKARLAWGQVGNAASVGAYSINNTYSLGTAHLGRPTANFSSGGNLPNPNLKPFTSTELEFGIDVRLFQNRVGLDLAIYNQATTDDILNANISRSSGYTSTSVNLGKITNKGIEILLTGTPIKGPITWDISLNFAKNNNNVKALIAGQDMLQGDEPRTRTVRIQHIVGHPYGMITGLKQMRSPDGQLVYNADGAPLTDGSYEILGSGVANFTGGITNTLSYKGVNLGFLVDFKAGGKIYSGTNVRMTQAGFTKQTLQGREGEAPLTVTGVTDLNNDGTYEPFTKTLTPGEAANYWSNLGDRAQENFIYDASFIKLRSLTLGYTLPKSLLSKTPFQTVGISFVARNLAILFKNTPNIDPESNYASGNSQGLDYFGVPPTRTFGFNLRASF